ncbi:MAG: phosphoribosylformylglycinamidine synthase subunit PurS [Firmicutes bacterium]|nr:phosphoribosylformylglycinamidine synthase subunit PurS [Bacillota bacterium]
MKFQGKIKIKLRPSILDPHAHATMKVLQTQGYSNVESLLIGKFMEVVVEAPSLEEAENLIHLLCQEVLTNPIMEDYELEVREV